MAKCWPLQMPPTPKAVLISLADNANDQGYCWPSLTKISERTCFGRTAVIEAIKWLESRGAIKGDRNDRYRTTYIVSPDSFVSIDMVRDANQSAKRTSSDDGELVRLADDEVRETDDEVRQADTNHQEPPRTVNKSKRQSSSLDLSSWPSEPSAQVLSDWLAMRKRKRADVSQTVIAAMAPQLALAAKRGWTVDECLSECVLRNWQGLKAEWLDPKQGSPPTKSSQPQGKQAQGLQILEGMKHGNRLDKSGNRNGLPEIVVARIGADASG